MSRRPRLLPAAGCAVLAAACLLPAAPSAGELSKQLQQVHGSEAPLKSGIANDNRHIHAYAVRIADIRVHLSRLQASLNFQEALLARDKSDLRRSRARLVRLRVALARDRGVLADQMRASYESPTPDLVSVVMDAHGFADLIERVDAIRTIGRQNARIVGQVRTFRNAVHAEAARLLGLTKRQQRVTSSVLVERDQVDQVRLDLVRRQAVFLRSRSHRATQLASLEARGRSLERRIAAQQQAAAAAVGSITGAYSVPATIGSFTAHGGTYGFFQAPGTNYSVGEEPALAAHLDALGRALQLHLIGISGYRTPQHSVEVGGFSNDPHTRGAASDTPGVESVPEATLNRFGLTRPFGGAAEADHIQLLGG